MSASSCCCQIRTGVLFLGFFLGTTELTLWVIFYTFRAGFRQIAGYDTEHETDLIVVSVVIALDLVVNVLLICGANKDYSGRKKDLRRWGFMIPWALVYTVNILGLIAGSVVLFYSCEGINKLFGLVPLFSGIFVLLGLLAVVYFIMEQKEDLKSYLQQHRQLPGAGSSNDRSPGS